MIFEELVLTDVGPFKGEQRIPLAPRSSDRPVVLFGGLNGAGKTTVLESLLLALYGGHTPGSSRRARSYEAYLRHLINHDADPARGAQVELAFRAVHDGAWRSFRILRRWSQTAERMRETVTVTRDGMPDQVLADGWAEYVETLAPRGVANLFFFDGEQIEAFADLDVAGELVRDAIGGLLGLDLVDRLQEDLALLERRKRQEAAASEEEAEQLQALQVQFERAQAAEYDTGLEVEHAEKDLAEAKAHEAAVTARLTREGGERFQAADQLQNRRRAAESAREIAHKTLIEALGGIGPLLLVKPLIERTLAQATAEQSQEDDKTLAALLVERDAELLELLQQNKAAAKIQQAVSVHLAADVNKRKAGAGVPEIVGTNTRMLAQIEQMLATDLGEEQNRLRACVDGLAAAQTAFDDAERVVAGIPAFDAVEEALAAHGKASAMLAEARARVEAAHAARTEAIERRRRAEKAIEEKQSNSQLNSEESLRIVENAARTRSTLAQLRAAATERHVQRIQALVLESLQSLMRKENLISEVKIDPVSCAVELLTHNGRPVRPRSLSAGERQLLAVALLAGLARASGRMLPVVIDTPLGRLDQDHRKRLIQRYLPHASHQVIVLSTDTEITPEVLHKLGDSVSHMVKLDHDPASRATTVSEGYFQADSSAADDEDQEGDEEL